MYKRKIWIGKSTLANILSGLIRPSTGKIFLNDKLIGKDNIYSRISVGFLSQDLFLDNTSIKEYIVLNEIKIDYKKYKSVRIFAI